MLYPGNFKVWSVPKVTDIIIWTNNELCNFRPWTQLWNKAFYQTRGWSGPIFLHWPCKQSTADLLFEPLAFQTTVYIKLNVRECYFSLLYAFIFQLLWISTIFILHYIELVNAFFCCALLFFLINIKLIILRFFIYIFNLSVHRRKRHLA